MGLQRREENHDGDIQMTGWEALMETKQGEKMRLSILYLMFIFVSSLIFCVEMVMPPYFFLDSLFIIYYLLGNIFFNL